MPAFVLDLGHGIYAVDTAFQREHFDAAYLMVHGGRAAFIDTGTNHAVPRLLAALQAVGLPASAVDWVIPTHVHLDHAGGVGLLLLHLPHARVLVHPRGARHLIRPEALWQGATAVYGPQEMARSYGQLVPVPEDRVLHSSDGMTVELSGRRLLLADTPGHARHHHCVWDDASQGWFTGDTFGLSYREFDTPKGTWILPSATPVRFEPVALRGSILRLLSQKPRCIYLTHFGRVEDVPRLGTLLLGLLDEMVDMARAVQQGPDRHTALKRGQLEIFSRSLRQQGSALSDQRIADLLAMDLELNAQGLAIWLDRSA